MTFINSIISYLTSNGTIDKKMLFEAPLLLISMIKALFGVFDDAVAVKVIKLIDGVNQNALVARKSA